MNVMFSAQELADTVNDWSERHQVYPVNGQAGERLSVRNIRYYRGLGLLDPPTSGGGQGFGEKHRLQLIAIRLLQAQGLPLNRIQELLFGRSVEELRRIECEGLSEWRQRPVPTFRPIAREAWYVTPVNDDYLLVSRRGQAVSAEVRQRLLEILNGKPGEKPPIRR